MKQRLSTLLSLYSLHVYAVAAILLAALSQQFAALLLLILLYLFDLFFVRPHATRSVSDHVAPEGPPSLSDPTADAGASFYAATAVDLNPFAVSLDDDVTPSVLDSRLPEHSTEESLPIHNLEVLQTYAPDLPEDLKLTMQDDGDARWVRAFQSMTTVEAPPAHSLLSHSTVEADDPLASPIGPDSSSENAPLPLVIIDDLEEPK